MLQCSKNEGSETARSQHGRDHAEGKRIRTLDPAAHRQSNSMGKLDRRGLCKGCHLIYGGYICAACLGSGYLAENREKGATGWILMRFLSREVLIDTK